MMYEALTLTAILIPVALLAAAISGILPEEE